MTITTATNKVMGFSKTTNDGRYENYRNARDIGTLVNDETTLSVRSSILKNDKSDVFSFKVKESTSSFGIVASASTDKKINGSEEVLSTLDVEGDLGYIRIQIKDKRGNIIADTSRGATAQQQEAYEKARQGELSLDAGAYFLEISRSDGTLNDKNSRYAVQLVSSETYTKKYDTVEYAYSQSNDSELQATSSAIVDMINSEAPDGTSMTNVFDYLA